MHFGFLNTFIRCRSFIMLLIVPYFVVTVNYWFWSVQLETLVLLGSNECRNLFKQIVINSNGDYNSNLHQIDASKFKSSKVTINKMQLLIFTPDIHDGTRIDLLSSIIALNHSIALSSAKKELPQYFHLNTRIRHSYDPNLEIPQVVIPKKPVLDPDSETPIEDDFTLRRYYQSMHRHQIIIQTDLIVCMFYPTQCQAFIPLNKTILFLPAHRYVLKRCSLQSVKLLHWWLFESNNSNILVRAASLYDAQYMNYYSGRDIPIIASSSVFAYTSPSSYHPIYTEILMAPLKITEFEYKQYIENACSDVGYSCRLTTILQKVGIGWKIVDLSKFAAVVVFPYAVLSYYLNDLFVSCVPMFVPSPAFLISLHLIDDSRNSDDYYCGEDYVPMKKHPNSKHPFSPEDNSAKARQYWLKFASFYTPATVQFNSWRDLAVKLHTSNLTDMFYRRVKENEAIKRKNIFEWKKVFKRVERNRTIPTSFDEALSNYHIDKFIQ